MQEEVSTLRVVIDCGIGDSSMKGETMKFVKQNK
jgi:hypothetical protein